MELTARIAELEQIKAGRCADAAERYHQLVIDSTDGAEVDPLTAAQTLVDANKTAEDLETDCQNLERRRGWAAVLSGADEHDKLAAEAQQRMNELVRKRQQQWAELTTEIDQLGQQRDTHLAYVTGLGTAKKQLQQTAWPHLQRRVAAIKEKLSAECGDIGQLEQHIATCQSIARGDQQQIDNNGPRKPSASDKEFLTQHRDGYLEQAAEAQQRLDSLKEVQQQLLAELAEAEAALLVP